MRLPVVLLVLVVACGSILPATLGADDLPDLNGLEREWECGHGFWVGTEDQTAALRFHFGGETPAPEVTLPDPDWEAVMLIGTDLYAEWCTDVIVDGEPVPVVHWELPIVAGRLVIDGEPPSAPFESTVLTVEASGLVVELPDGQRVPLGTITITNRSWGLLPG